MKLLLGLLFVVKVHSSPLSRFHSSTFNYPLHLILQVLLSDVEINKGMFKEERGGGGVFGCRSFGIYSPIWDK